MPYNPNIHNRQSIRLKGYDYSKPGYYFVTFNIKKRLPLFGKIIRKNNKAKMQHTELGKAAIKFWLEIPEHYPNVILDEFIIMPDHIHGIIQISERQGAQNIEKGRAQNIEAGRAQNIEQGRVQNIEPKQNKYQKIIPGSLGAIIRGYKIGVTKWAKQNGYENFIWQRNFHEKIIHNERALNNIRQYIKNNPKNWKK